MPLKITCKKTGDVFTLYDFKNKAQIEVKETHDHLDDAVADMHETFADDLEGYVVIAWGKGSTWDAGIHCSPSVTLNTLPEFVAGALRRQIAMRDAGRVLGVSEEEDDA